MNIAPGTFQGLAESEVELFRKVLKGVSGVGVEIGCLDGYSSAVILDASELHLTSIDPFIPDSMEVSLRGEKSRYLENVAPYGDRAKLLETYSWKAIQTWYRSIDFLFIDGDHRLDDVFRDFNDWHSHLVRGGLLAMHDARMGREGSPSFHEGPSKIAREHIFAYPENWEVIGEAFTLVIARKL